MYTTAEIAKVVPWVLGIGSLAAIAAVGMSLFKLLATGPSPVTRALGAIILAIGTLVFYFILWVCCTILDPKTNHLWIISALYAVNGVLPALFLSHGRGQLPDETTTTIDNIPNERKETNMTHKT
jgi:hypothetical protein